MKNVKFARGSCFVFFHVILSRSVSLEEMTHEERSSIKDLEKCDFGEIHAMHVAKVEARRNMSKEEKLVRLKIYIYIFDDLHDVCYLFVTLRESHLRCLHGHK